MRPHRYPVIITDPSIRSTTFSERSPILTVTRGIHRSERRRRHPVWKRSERQDARRRTRPESGTSRWPSLAFRGWAVLRTTVSAVGSGLRLTNVGMCSCWMPKWFCRTELWCSALLARLGAMDLGAHSLDETTTHTFTLGRVELGRTFYIAALLYTRHANLERRDRCRRHISPKKRAFPYLVPRTFSDLAGTHFGASQTGWGLLSVSLSTEPARRCRSSKQLRCASSKYYFFEPFHVPLTDTNDTDHTNATHIQVIVFRIFALAAQHRQRDCTSAHRRSQRINTNRKKERTKKRPEKNVNVDDRPTCS